MSIQGYVTGDVHRTTCTRLCAQGYVRCTWLCVGGYVGCRWLCVLNSVYRTV